MGMVGIPVDLKLENLELLYIGKGFRGISWRPRAVFALTVTQAAQFALMGLNVRVAEEKKAFLSEILDETLLYLVADFKEYTKIPNAWGYLPDGGMRFYDCPRPYFVDVDAEMIRFDIHGRKGTRLYVERMDEISLVDRLLAKLDA